MKREMWNPWHGCHKCSDGCKNCFVYFFDGKRERDANTVTRSKSGFDLPRKKTRDGTYKIASGSEVATCFTSDFFIEEADPWRDEAWDIIKTRPDLNFLICTKRIRRFGDCTPDDWGNGYDNVTIAVSCENQAAAKDRLPYLLDAKCKRKYIFAAPLLEYVDFGEFLKDGKIDAVFAGGESYKNARACDFSWIKQIKRDCNKFGVKFDFHQTGSNFIYNGKHYKIPHRDEYAQAKKGMKLLET